MGDIFKNARSCINRGVIESLFSSPGCHWRHDQFVTLSPLKSNDSIEGFEISESGLWHDFRSDEGGDLIDLLCESQNITKKEAAETIIKTGGGVVDDSESYEEKKPELPKYHKFDYEDSEIIGRLKKYLFQDWQKRNSGQASSVYFYKDGKGKAFFCTVRFVKDKKKSVKPVYMDRQGNFYNKAPKGLDVFLPYGIEKLIGNEDPVIIVEGEKCANINVKDFVLLSSYNINKTDWSCLKNRDVFIWPDLDCKKDDFGNYKDASKQPGYIKALRYQAKISHAQVFDFYGKYKLGLKKDGWDIADADEEGKDIPEYLKTVGIVGAVNVDLIPLDVYLKFIEHQYNENGLEQINGTFWNYDETDYYWKKIKRVDLDVHFQKWVFDTKIINLLHTDKKSKPTTFINDSLSYLHRHTNNYFKDNPFKDSALSPFIHHKDGVIEIRNTDIKFIKRSEKDKTFFKELYPIFCFDYGLSEEKYNEFELGKDCPAFNYFIEEMVPKTLKGELREKQVELTKLYMSQIFAYCLSPLKYDPYVFNITGKQHTGKTFFVDIIKKFIGDDFVLERSMDSMENRFATYDLWGSKIFVESDVSAEKVIPDDFVKKFAGEIHGVTVEQKHEDPIKGVKLSIAMFFISNYQIKFGNKIEGIERRLCPIPFRNKLLKKDKSLLNKIIGNTKKGSESGKYKGETFNELPGILAFALNGWLQFVENNYEFTLPDWIVEEKEVWKMESNTIIKYISETYKITDRTETIDRLTLYNNYVDWCKEEGHTSPFGRNNFYKELRNMDYVRELENANPRMFIINEYDKDYEDEIPF